MAATVPKKNRPKKKNPFDIEYGSETDKYKWTQTATEVNVTVPIPKGTKGKEVNVVMHTQSLAVGLKGKDFIINGQLIKPIPVDDCYWQLDDTGSNVEITLIKTEKKVWWPSVFPGEAEIDVSKIEGSSHLDENLLLRLRREHAEKIRLEEEEEDRKEAEELAKQQAAATASPAASEEKPSQ